MTKSCGSVKAVGGIDLVITPGETVALLGPTGAGKTTAIDMMLGFRGPDSGAVAVIGVPPATAVGSRSIGGMLQTGSLPDCLRVRELAHPVDDRTPAVQAIADILLCHRGLPFREGFV